jgi:hypothetical protein
MTGARVTVMHGRASAFTRKQKRRFYGRARAEMMPGENVEIVCAAIDAWSRGFH